LEARLPGASDGTKIFESPDLQSFCWLAPGHLVLNRWEAADQPTSNLWEIGLDPTAMKPVDKPRRLTNWAGFAVGHMSASRDGRRLAVTKRFDQVQLVVGDLADDGEKSAEFRESGRGERSGAQQYDPESEWILDRRKQIPVPMGNLQSR
jgi:hypothetical protein